MKRRLARDGKRMSPYNTVQLIELVQQRPVLWNKTMDGFMDRKKKKDVWKEIFRSLIHNYDKLTEAKKVTAGKAIMDKWKNIRDAFNHSRKKRKILDKRVKYYIYEDELQFLVPFIWNRGQTEPTVCKSELGHHSEEDEQEQEQEQEQKETDPLYEEMIDEVDYSPAQPVASPKRSKTEYPTIELESDDTNTNDFESMDPSILNAKESNEDTPPPSSQIDEHTSFFASITSTVRQFNEDETLTFRIEVLNLIKQIKGKRKHTSKF